MYHVEIFPGRTRLQRKIDACDNSWMALQEVISPEVEIPIFDGIIETCGHIYVLVKLPGMDGSYHGGNGVSVPQVNGIGEVLIIGIGTAWLDNNHQIHYLPNEGYFGDETISYKVERWGLSAQSTIAFSVRDLPEFNGMNANSWPTDDRLCLESVGSFNPTANWIDHGASVFYQGWMWSSSNTPNNWQESASFANVGIGDYNIRFEARNSCNDNLTWRCPAGWRSTDDPTESGEPLRCPTSKPMHA